MKEIEIIGKKIIGPVIFPYIVWVIKSAQEQGISRLYFLARDGYLLHKIAVQYCKYFKVDIECRYLYCSRFSLRLPTYYFLKNEGIDLLFTYGEDFCLNTIFSRLRLDEEERNQVLNSLDINIAKEKILTIEEIMEIKKKLCKNPTFLNFIKIKSIKAYHEINEYFKQEGVYSKNKIGIIDSGWAGTMQKSLFEIISHGGYKTKLVGFYFGLFNLNFSQDYGQYFSWYFSPKKGFWKKVLFNNSVFECMLSAPHEMTIGYKRGNTGQWEPIFKNTGFDNANIYSEINMQIQSCMDYVQNQLHKINIEKVDLFREKQKIFFLLSRFMVMPSKKQVEVYGKFFFSGEVSEEKLSYLANISNIPLLKNYLMWPRVKRKFLFRKNLNEYKWLYWAYGSAAFLPFFKRIWYVLNIIASECRRIHLLSR